MENASVSLSFSGDAVMVFGTVSPDHANVQVSMDGSPPSTFNGGSDGTVSGLHTKVCVLDLL